MNFTFADARNLFTDMIQSDLPREIMSKAKSADTTGISAFAKKLEKTIANENPLGTQNAVAYVGKFSATASSRLETLAQKLDQTEGTSFVEVLKTFLTALSGGDLKDVTLDESGLAALKKMLLKAGYKESDIDKLFTELMPEDGDQAVEINLDDLFNSLSELGFEPSEEVNSQDITYIDATQLPFIESILVSMGLTQEKVEKLFSGIEIDEEKGVSLDAVLDVLKSIRKSAFYAGEQIQVKDGQDDQVNLLFKQLGLEEYVSQKDADFSLDDLIGSLEALRTQKRQILSQTQTNADQISSVPGSENKLSQIISDFFAGLKSVSENDSGMTTQTSSLLSVSENQVKDSVQSGVLAQLVSQIPVGRDNEVNAAFKEAAKAIVAALENDELAQTQDKKGLSDMLEAAGLLKGKNSGRSELKETVTLAGTDSSRVQQNQSSGAGQVSRPVKTLPAYVTQQVGKGIVRAINQGEETVRIQLKPPELGRLMMTIDHSGNTMKVSIITESLAAKEILTTNMAELKTVMSNSGVTLEQFEVDMSSDFRQSLADARGQSGQFSKRRQNKGEDSQQTSSTEGMSEADTAKNMNADGALHYVA